MSLGVCRLIYEPQKLSTSRRYDTNCSLVGEMRVGKLRVGKLRVGEMSLNHHEVAHDVDHTH